MKQFPLRWWIAPSLMLSLLALPFAATGRTAPDTAARTGTDKIVRSPVPATTNLSPIVVQGQRVPIPVALQVLKNALARPWSGAWKDRNKVVCRTVSQIGSHFYRLRCQTNLDHAREASATQLSLLAIPPGGGGSSQEILTEIVRWADQRPVNPAGLHALLAKLPPAGSSYTLEMTDHGQVVSKWVFKKGKLVEVWHKKKGGGTR